MVSIVKTYWGERLIDDRPYWHLASPFPFYNNVRCGYGEVHSISATIAANPALTQAQTAYSAGRGDDAKESIFEEVRRARFSTLPPRLKSFFVFDDKALADRANAEWFKNENRAVHECRLVLGSIIHKADAKWLEAPSEHWKESAEKYWSGGLSDSPFPEIIVQGYLYFPDWKEFPAGFYGTGPASQF